MFTGVIEGVDPVTVHQLRTRSCGLGQEPPPAVLEPEGRKTDEWYVQGLSTSMPEEVQQKILHRSKGWKAELMCPGYAIEYDVVSLTNCAQLSKQN